MAPFLTKPPSRAGVAATGPAVSERTATVRLASVWPRTTRLTGRMTSCTSGAVIRGSSVLLAAAEAWASALAFCLALPALAKDMTIRNRTTNSTMPPATR